MAPATTPATAAGGGARTAAAVARSEGNSNRSAAPAPSVGLGLPALPAGVGLASRGQPRRVASSCRRLARRNVVSMAVGGPTSAPLADNEELGDFVTALKQEWDGIENKYVATTVAVAVTLGMWSAGAVVSAIDKLPVVPGLMEVVGVGYSGWFAYKNLLFKPDRAAFFNKVRALYEDIISG